ncbi:MAG: hypothetical protein PHV11_03805 [Candidatus Bipolaricaulis sp.]|nr:hypothetical protein [Candidatus Bipolaricaulis sp.]
MSITAINSKTWRATLPGGDIEIGDISAATFKPHIKLIRWEGECEIAFAFPISRTNNAILSGDRLIWNGGANYEIRFYEISTGTNGHNELGGFEFELVLKKKPPVNSFTFTVDIKNLVWYYQTPLTAAEIEQGAQRPDDVVGSYAVYHATRTQWHSNKEDAEKYKCGKAFHLYRPKVTDSSATPKTTWAILNLVGNQMTLTVDQTWLNSATYPVVIDPNFGYETAGASQYHVANAIYGSDYACTQAGTATSLSAYVWPDTTNKKVKFGYYNDGTHAFVGNVAEFFYANTNKHWETKNLVGTPAVSAATFDLVIWSETGETNYLGYDSVSGASYCYYAVTYAASFPTPVTFTKDGSKKLSIYCTYTVAASGWTGIAKVNGVGQAALAKVSGVAKASIAKISGVAV